MEPSDPNRATDPRRFTLRAKLLLSMLVILALSTVLLLYVVHVSMQARTRAELSQELDSSIHTFQSFNTRREELSVRMADLLANLPSIKSLLQSNDEMAIQDGTTKIAAGAGGNMFVLADASGHVVALHTSSVMGPQLVQPLMDGVFKSGRTSDWWYADGRLYEVFFRPVTTDNEGQGKPLGLLGFGYEIDAPLAGDVSRIADAQVVFLYNDTPVVSTLAASEQREFAQTVPQLLRESSLSSELRLSNERFLTATVPLASRNGHGIPSLVVLKSFEKSAQFIASLRWLMVELGLLAVVAGGLLVLLLSTNLTRPLRALLTGVHALEKGDYSYPLVPEGSDEIADLTSAFARMRATLRRNQEERLRSARMEALGRLAGGVAHDFNNLVTIITGYSDLAQDQVPPDSLAIKHLQQIRDAGKRAASLTRQLLAFSRKQMLQPELLDLNKLVERSANMLRVLMGAAIEMRLKLGANLPVVLADAGQFEQILLNFAANARDAMPNGGFFEIATSTVTADEVPAKVRPAAERFARISVTDSGSGIDKETLAHIFEPFYTTKEPGKGTGLGLATVFGIVEQSGGWLDVQSQIGKGTTFTILIPAHAGRAAEKPEPDAAVAVTGEGTILIVEDDDALRALMVATLSARRYRVLDAKDGVAGMQLAKSHTGKIDLVITDVVMPRLGGREMITLLLADRPEMRILYISGYTDREIWEFELGKHAGFLQKPFTPATLLQTVHTILTEPAPVESAVRAQR
jgi:signal transduction histidine kinase